MLKLFLTNKKIIIYLMCIRICIALTYKFIDGLFTNLVACGKDSEFAKYTKCRHIANNLTAELISLVLLYFSLSNEKVFFVLFPIYATQYLRILIERLSFPRIKPAYILSYSDIAIIPIAFYHFLKILN